MLRRRVCTWSIKLLLAIPSLPVFSQTAAEWDSPRVNAIAQKLRCSCGCKLTMACQMPPHPCPTCKKNRIRIFQMLTEGKSERDILNRYIAEEGTDVLWVTPGFAGKSGPYVALACGFGGVLLVIRRYRHNATSRVG